MKVKSVSLFAMTELASVGIGDFPCAVIAQTAIWKERIEERRAERSAGPPPIKVA